jgi:hypothetical protein
MRQLPVLASLVLELFVLSASLAQSLAGNYIYSDDQAGQVNLSVEQASDNTLTGAMSFMGAVLQFKGQVTGAGTGTGEFLPVNGQTVGGFTLQQQGDQLMMQFEDGGNIILFTREGTAPVTTQPTDNSGGNTIITDGEDTIVTDEGDTIITDDGGVDEEEVAYCQDFLADAEAVAEDPDEETYCKDVLSAAVSAPVQTDSTQQETNPLNVPNPLGNNGAQNPLTATPDAFSGTYRGDKIALTVQLASAQYTGTLEFNAQSYPVQAAAQGDKLVGTFQANGSPFEFSFYPQETFFVLESGGQKYNLMKQP